MHHVFQDLLYLGVAILLLIGIFLIAEGLINRRKHQTSEDADRLS